MTSQAISGYFAKVSNFTELKNFTIALSVFMVVDNVRLCVYVYGCRSEMHRFEFHYVPLT